MSLPLLSSSAVVIHISEFLDEHNTRTLLATLRLPYTRPHTTTGRATDDRRITRADGRAVLALLEQHLLFCDKFQALMGNLQATYHGTPCLETSQSPVVESAGPGPIRAKRTRMTVIGHRGAKGYARDNTLASFHKALEIGVDIIETDVNLLRSGELIVYHDAVLPTSTIRVRDASLAQVKDACPDAITLHMLFSDEAIVNSNVIMYLDLKDIDLTEAVMRFLDNIVRSTQWSWDRILVASFSQRQVIEARVWCEVLRGSNRDSCVAPSFGVIIDGSLETMSNSLAAVGVQWLSMNSDWVTPEIVKRAHSKGIRVACWTVNCDTEMRRLGVMGVDAICSDFPDRVKNIQRWTGGR